MEPSTRPKIHSWILQSLSHLVISFLFSGKTDKLRPGITSLFLDLSRSLFLFLLLFLSQPPGLSFYRSLSLSLLFFLSRGLFLNLSLFLLLFLSQSLDISIYRSRGLSLFPLISLSLFLSLENANNYLRVK